MATLVEVCEVGWCAMPLFSLVFVLCGAFCFCVVFECGSLEKGVVALVVDAAKSSLVVQDSDHS